MAAQMRWVGEDELDAVVETRMLSVRSDRNDVETMRLRIRQDRRAQPGDYLLAETDGQLVGTATALSMTLWARGSAIPCQGVAHVGTLKTHRRNQAGGKRGIASQMMDQVLAIARERQQVVSALMPFRNSFYEHFGYGLVEHRVEWTVPLTLLPRGPHRFRYMRDDDREAVLQLRVRESQRGQCDIERSRAGWDYYLHPPGSGLQVIDRPAHDGPARGWIHFRAIEEPQGRWLQIMDLAHDSPQAFIEALHFLGSLKDQYRTARLSLPRDLPLNRLLRESQLVHYAAPHDSATCRTTTRMQLRVLDHARFLEALHLPPHARGRCTLRIHESEGHVSTFGVDLSDGRMVVRPTQQSPQVVCQDVQWAAIASGDLPASQAACLGLIESTDDAALAMLDALSVGPAPFCREYF